MSVNTRVVPINAPHKINQEARGMKINWPEMVTRARSEKWAWQPPDDIPEEWEGPLITVINHTNNERIPWYQLTDEQKRHMRQSITTVLEDAIKQQMRIIEIKKYSSNDP